MNNLKAQAYCLLAEIQRPAFLLAGLHSNPRVTARFYSFGTEPNDNYNCSTQLHDSSEHVVAALVNVVL